MAWRLAYSLETLRQQLNAAAPNRSKRADGTIGDAAHSARTSRHNPNRAGVVCALDITHDPAGGMDTYALFDILREHPHPNLEYVISNRRIASRSSGWLSRPYTGSSPHTAHTHIAVGRGPDSEPAQPYDDRTPWTIVVPQPKPVEDDMADPEVLAMLTSINRSMEAVAADVRALKDRFHTHVYQQEARDLVRNALLNGDHEIAKREAERVGPGTQTGYRPL